MAAIDLKTLYEATLNELAKTMERALIAESMATRLEAELAQLRKDIGVQEGELNDLLKREVKG